MSKFKYKKRIVDTMLKRRLMTMGAVLIEGPKLCGKSTTALQQAASVLNMEPGRTLELARLDPKLILQGEVPRLLDEWQLAPNLWDAIRREVDARNGEKGQFMLTGSAVPVDVSLLKHSGTGRFAWLKMRPMTLVESGESSGAVSLKALFDGKHEIGCVSNGSLEETAFCACRGGWPPALQLEPEFALDHAFNYVKAIIHADISRADDVKRNEETTRRLLRSYARHQGAQISAPELAKDIEGSEGRGVTDKTILGYLNALKKIFVIEDLPAWSPNLRSKTAIRTSDTRYFSDPSIAAGALGIGPQDLLLAPKTFGFVFETLCVRDLRVYAEALDGNLYHYRDKSGLECDAVIHRRNGAYGLIEIKLGSEQGIADGVRTLKALADKLDTTKMQKPAFLMVLTALGDFAYRRDDGVLVVPIASLGP